MPDIRVWWHRNHDPKDPILYPFHWQKKKKKKQPISSVGKSVEQVWKCTRANSYNHFRRESGNSYGSWIFIYLTIQQNTSPQFTPKKTSWVGATGSMYRSAQNSSLSVAKTWKRPGARQWKTRCRNWFVHTMDYYSIFKTNEPSDSNTTDKL